MCRCASLCLSTCACLAGWPDVRTCCSLVRACLCFCFCLALLDKQTQVDKHARRQAGRHADRHRFRQNVCTHQAAFASVCLHVGTSVVSVSVRCSVCVSARVPFASARLRVNHFGDVPMCVCVSAYLCLSGRLAVRAHVLSIGVCMSVFLFAHGTARQTNPS